MIPCDLHVHSDHSIDAHSSLRQYCDEARRIGLKAIGLTTHYDVNPARSAIDPFMVIDGRRVIANDYAIRRYIDDCKLAQAQFPELKILVGLEIDYFPGVEIEVARLRAKFPFDYLIGSVHCLDGVALSSRQESAAYLASHSVDAMADQYFDLLLGVAESGLFDTIGHADYYIRNASDFYDDGIYRVFEGRLEKVVRAAVRAGTGFEINTSCSRHGYGDHYPALDFLKQAVAFGAKINSIGSDAHQHQDLGHRLVETCATLEASQIRFSPFYENR